MGKKTNQTPYNKVLINLIDLLCPYWKVFAFSCFAQTSLLSYSVRKKTSDKYYPVWILHTVIKYSIQSESWHRVNFMITFSVI